MVNINDFNEEEPHSSIYVFKICSYVFIAGGLLE